MKIKQVEELVGITRKNIRFYEEQGLLNVERADNGYREYNLEDVERLKKIKLLRKFSVPIENIKKVFEEELSLSDCLDRQMDELERQKNNIIKMKRFGEQMLSKKDSIHTLNAEECLETIERMEKEGIEFMDLEKTDKKRKRKAGAIIGAAIMILIMLLTLIVLWWANSVDPVPIGILLFLMLMPVVVVIGVVVALIGRIKEIRGGEEDEASKY